MGLTDKLYSDCAGFLELRAIAPKKPTKRKFVNPCSNPEIAAFVREHSKEYNIYLGVATRDGVGGGKENLVHIPAIWCDLDFKSQNQATCDAKLAKFPLPPTIKIDSGGGYHVYWVFREPYTKEDIPRVEAALKGVCSVLGGDMDATDASRILRLPRTINHKYTPPKTVKILYENGSKYNLADFDDFAEHLVALEPPSDHDTDHHAENISRIMSCAFMAHCREDAHSLPESHWYAMIGQLCRERGGPDAIHSLSRSYSKGHSVRYSPSETDKKIIHALRSGPMTCEKIKEKLGWDCGTDCGVKSPAALAYRKDVTHETFVTNETFANQCNQHVTKCNLAEHGQMTTAVRQWLDGMEGQFHYRELAQDLQLNNKTQVQNLKVILHRLVNDNVLEKTGQRTGQYRIRNAQLVKIDWKTASPSEYPVALPLGLSDLVKLHPKNIAIVAGDRNSAKTAFLLNLAAMNAFDLECHYFSSEMGPEEYRDRIEEFIQHTPYPSSVWDRVNVWDRNKDFQDVIIPDSLNIIDFLEIENEFWRVNEKIARIWERLTTGIAVIGLQKKIGAEHGRGGDFSAEKARLYLTFSLDETPEGFTNIGKIMKCKSFRDENPNGWSSRFKVFKGSRLIPVSPWCYPKH